MLSPQGSEESEKYFKEAYLDPAMQSYEQDTLPAIHERFSGDQGASSALNQTLARSAKDLQTDLRGQYSKQQYGAQQDAMRLFQQLLGSKTFDPYVKEQEGWLPGAAKAGGSVLNAILALL